MTATTTMRTKVTWTRGGTWLMALILGVLIGAYRDGPRAGHRGGLGGAAHASAVAAAPVDHAAITH